MWDLSAGELESAWERVLENAGCAGVDGVTVEQYGRRGGAWPAGLAEELALDAYRCLPLLQIAIEKKPGIGGRRTLLIPTVKDRIVQTAAARRLSKAFEEEFLEASYAYRPGRSVDRAIARIVQWRERGCSHAILADIRGFFDHVNHRILLNLLSEDADAKPALPLLEQWIRAWYWDGKRLHRVRSGVAQGSPISPLIANYFLSGFDLRMEAANARLVRYADDFVLLCQSAKEADAPLPQVREELRRLNLELNPEKTEVASFDEGFTFLGAMFLGEKVYTPWKRERAPGRVLSMAHRMPQALLTRFRERQRGRPRAKRARVTPDVQPNPERTEGEDMAFLYLTEQGSVLRKSGDRVLVEAEDRVVLDIPYHKLEAVLLFGNVQITSAAAGELLDKGVRLSFFTRHGRFIGAGVPASGKNVPLRMKQFQACEDGARAQGLARAVVGGKIGNAVEVLQHLSEQNAGILRVGWRSTFEEAMRSAEKAPNIAMLDGIEGAAARDYFDCLMRFNKSTFRWDGRRRRPPPDPLNALLSLTYTMLTHELTGLLDGVGLDPYLGFLHQMDYGRPSLALDLVEGFRHPAADRFVLRLVNLGIVGEKDFHHDPAENQCLLNSDMAKRFFAEYEEWMLQPRDGGRGYRDRMRSDVERLASAIEHGAEWTPYRMNSAEIT